MDTNNNLLTNKSFRSIIVTLATLLVVFAAVKIIAETKSLKYIGAVASNTINVSGKGEVLATPDIASFSFTVTEEAASVPEAQKKATNKMNTILAYVKQSGVDEKDVKTLSYNIYPRYEYTNGTYYTAGKQTLAAYVVSQTIDIKVRKMDDAGKLLSGIGEYGATDVSGLNFTVDKIDDVTREARDKAIEDARAQAKVLAKSLGVSLGRIVNYSESGSGYPMPMYYAKDMAYGGAANQSSALQLPSGESKITSNVSITYEIK